MANSRNTTQQKLTRMRRLGEMLLQEGLVSEEQLRTAEEERTNSGGLLSEILVAHGAIGEGDLAKCLVTQLQLPFIYTAQYDIPNDVVDKLPHAFLHQHRIVPLDIFGRTLVLATAGSLSQETVEEIESTTSFEVMLYIALSNDIQRTLQARFPLEKVANELFEKFDELYNEPEPGAPPS